jgi:hypothetical protein
LKISLAGWVAAAAIAGGTVLYAVKIHDFLALNQPVHGDILVIEGWFPDVSAMLDAADAARNGNYQRIVCVAAEMSESTRAPSAQRAAERLLAMGIDAARVHVIVVKHAERDRTFRCAIAVRRWLECDYPAVRSIDVFTVGIHSRKSYVLYERAMPRGFKVGVIAGTESGYPVSHWWFSVHGVYLIFRNTIGYLYAIMHPKLDP